MKIIKNKLKIKKPIFFENKKIEGHYISNPFTYKKPQQLKIILKKYVTIENGIKEVINFLKKKYENK